MQKLDSVGLRAWGGDRCPHRGVNEPIKPRNAVQAHTVKYTVFMVGPATIRIICSQSSGRHLGILTMVCPKLSTTEVEADVGIGLHYWSPHGKNGGTQ